MASIELVTRESSFPLVAGLATSPLRDATLLGSRLA
jgi:hypothetical protein